VIVHVATATHDISPLSESVHRIHYDEDGFTSLLSRYSYDDIYFMAGNSSPSNSEDAPYLDMNLTNLPLLSLLATASKNRFKGRLWFASSVAVYGGNNEDELHEQSACLPLSYYAVSKLMAEEHLKMFNRVHGLNTGIFRIFSTYGGGLTRQLIYDIYRKIRANPIEVSLHGTGREARDLSYVEDQVDAMLAVADQVCPAGEIWNIGSGKLYSVDQIFQSIRDILQAKTQVKYSYPMRTYDGVCWRADISKLRALNFEPRFTLESGLRKTIDAYDKKVVNDSKL
jgi:UDP-glucose 4-epimerase